MKENINYDKEIMDFLYKKIFNPGLSLNKGNINKIIDKTIKIFEKEDVKGKIRRFWYDISTREDIEERLKKNNLTTFGDIKDEFDEKFSWLLEE